MILGRDEANKALRAQHGQRGTQARRAAAASVIGTTIEWYDFFLYNTAAALIFPAVFFPESSSYAGAMQSFATYAVGFAARPVGAAIFGYWGDRIGRKTTLIITLLLMGIASGVIGVLPGTDSIGIVAPIMLVVLRLIQGIAVGGEWSGSVLLAMEWGDQRKRGLLASFAQMGVPMGLVLGTGGMTLLSALLPAESFTSWGWRIPFLASLVLVAVGLVIRLRILETPMFAAVVAERRTSSKPVTDAVKHHWREILLSAGLRFSEQMPFYLFTSFVLVYAVEERDLSKTFVLNAVLVAAAIELATIPLFSRLSDSIGRKRVYLSGAILVGALAFPYFAVLKDGSALAIFLIVIASMIPHAMQYGPQAALIGESFPTHLRYGGAGLGYQLASVFAGGPAPLLATWLLHSTGTPFSISAYIVFSAVVTVVCVIVLPDRSRADITDDNVYARTPGKHRTSS
ncbi:Major Facilitator Superfamily protein [Prauserella marina]|uniref:Major Facilitator Superfamily protein n=1 Tax=Prauserella marina TaxID=530584 RepID=A0A1G6R7L2_9PSEU|nr:MFS transporter [Prauserella marina]PWV76922.1 MFS transporter [Prauserella marina]SDD00431.1 Major Facilitator Superfamily protein [Prauserella marina]